MSSKFLNGSRLIVEGAFQAGAEAYSGYPITPANRIYSHAVRRAPMVLKAPDEITALQWASGLSASGRIPLTATSGPGFALMVETVNMAFMMELPVAIGIAQRLGPSTGSATTGAQGDVGMLNRLTSGGYNFPVLCPSNLADCFELAAKSIHLAVDLRTPTVLLTSKEMVQTERSFDTRKLSPVEPVRRNYFTGPDFHPYSADESMVPEFVPLGSDRYKVRLTSSTHGESGVLQKANESSMANTARLNNKIAERKDEFSYFEYESSERSDVLVVSYGITSYSAREAVAKLRSQGRSVSLLITKTLLPVPSEVKEIIMNYDKVIVAEENLTGLYREILFGQAAPNGVSGVNAIGRMVSPDDIIQEVNQIGFSN